MCEVKRGLAAVENQLGGRNMKYFRMLIENVKTGEKKTYISTTQGRGSGYPWKVTCVLGYYEK